METVRLSSHSEMLFGSVCRASSPVPLTESVYHLFNFFLARGGEQGELCLPECQSGAAYNTVCLTVSKNSLLCFPDFSFSRATVRYPLERSVASD